MSSPRLLRAAAFFGLVSTSACSLLLSDDFTSPPSAPPAASTEAGSIDSGLESGDASVPPDSATPSDSGPDGSPVIGCSAAQTDPSLVAYYAFDEGGGTTLKDCSGHGHDGVIEGAASWTAGKHGGALGFNGTSTCVNLGKQLGPAAFTVVGWVNVTNYRVSGISGYILGKTSNANVIGWRFGTLDGPNRFEGKLGLTPTPALLTSPGGQPTATWLHVGLILIPGQRSDLYVNGARVVGGGSPPPISEDANANLRIGCNNGAKDYFQGMIDELRIYTRALDDGEIAALAK